MPNHHNPETGLYGTKIGRRVRASSFGKFTALLLSAVLFVPSALAFHRPRGIVTPASEITNDIFHQVVWVSLAIFVIVEVMLLYFVFKYKKRKGSPEKGPEIHGNTKLEIAWTIGPALIMIWLLIISFNGMQAIDYGPTDGSEPEFEIDVIASQFAWTFVYPDGTKVNADPAPKDDNDVSQLTEDELPANVVRFQEDTWVQFNVASRDVIHAFAVNDWDMIVDAQPCQGDPAEGVQTECKDEKTHVWTKVSEPGIYLVQCRQYCGVGHGHMTAIIEVFAAGSQTAKYGYDPVEPEPGQDAPAADAATVPEDFAGRVFDASLVDFDIVWSLDGAMLEYPEFVPGEEIAIRVTNDGDGTHNLFLGDYTSEDDVTTWENGESETLGAGESTVMMLTVPDVDQAFKAWCHVPGHVALGMITDVLVGDAEIGAGDEGPTPMLPGPSPALVAAGVIGLAAVAAGLRRRD